MEITVGNYDKFTGDEDPTIEALIEGLVGADELEYTITRVPGENAGSYDLLIEVKDNPNYNFIINIGKLSINNRPVAPTPTVVPTPSVVPTIVPTPTTTPVVEVEPTVTPSIEPTTTPTTDVENDNVDDETIIDGETPEQANNNGSWSLFDLITTLITVVLLVAYVVYKKSNDEEDKTELKRRKLSIGIIGLFTISSIILFVLTQDLTLPMTIFDSYSIIFAVILVVQIILFIFMPKYKENNDDNEISYQG